VKHDDDHNRITLLYLLATIPQLPALLIPIVVLEVDVLKGQGQCMECALEAFHRAITMI